MYVEEESSEGISCGKAANFACAFLAAQRAFVSFSLEMLSSNNMTSREVGFSTHSLSGVPTQLLRWSCVNKCGTIAGASVYDL